MRLIFLILITSIFFLTSSVFAAAPPGLQKKGMSTTPSGHTPPGWDEGLKKGWNKDKNWHWDKKDKEWENKNWQWNSTTKTWHKTKGQKTKGGGNKHH